MKRILTQLLNLPDVVVESSLQEGERPNFISK